MRFVFPILLMAAGMADAQDFAARLKQIDSNNAAIQSALSTTVPPGYLESANRAVAENKPLVIFVGQEPRPVPGSIRSTSVVTPCLVNSFRCWMCRSSTAMRGVLTTTHNAPVSP